MGISFDNISIWRLQLNTGGGNIGKHCKEKHVAALGWSFVGENLTQEDLDSIGDNFSRYEALCKKINWECNSNVKRMVFDVKEGDIIWMHYEGKYYFARIKAESKWQFNSSVDSFSKDACNEITNIDWIEAGEYADEISIPGAIATGFYRGSTFQRINKPSVREFSQYLYNLYAKDSFLYPYPKMKLDQKTFYSMIQPDDAEDLAYAWLYSKFGYIVVPSSNKKGTQKYEFVMLDPKSANRKHIYIQVKKGEVDLDAKDFEHLKGETYLFTTDGEIKNYDDSKHSLIHIVDPKEIYEFAIDEKNHNIISDSIIKWCNLLSEMDSITKNSNSTKGIMFDTNRGVDETSELDMLLHNKISAYGKAKRYVRSFNKCDYVLYYASGKGIFAIGQIKSGSEKEGPNEELFHEVNIIIPSNMNWEKDNYKFLSPSEIKTILNKGFFFASTIKTPFLEVSQVKLLETALRKKYLNQ